MNSRCVFGVRLLRAVELFHALGGLLVAQAHATQELLQPVEKVQNFCFKKKTIQAVTSLFFLEKKTCLTTVHIAHKVISASQ